MYNSFFCTKEYSKQDDVKKQLNADHFIDSQAKNKEKNKALWKKATDQVQSEVRLII